MKNMKFEINDCQHLNDVVLELERLGYQCEGYLTPNDIYLLAQHDGNIIGCDFDLINDYWQPTTLAELRSMNIETLKEM